MKKILSIAFLCIITFLFNLTTVCATPGALQKKSIKTCGNGITYGYHKSNGQIHWHQANADSDVSSGWIAVGEPIDNDPCDINNSLSNSNTENSNDTSSNANTSSNNDSNSNNNSSNNSSNNITSSNSNINKTESTKKEENKKSSDNTLKTITIDGKSYNNFDNIVHVTSSENVNIEVTTNNDSATYDIKNIEPLVVGDNHISIVITAENGSTKTYNIIVNKERKLSAETGIEVIINDEKVVFEQYEATINVDSSITKLDIDYTLKDDNASVEMNEIGELESGDNILIIKVVAENGIQQEYKITIYKYSKTEDIIYTTIGLGVLGGSGYGIYKIAKKKKINK